MPITSTGDAAPSRWGVLPNHTWWRRELSVALVLGLLAFAAFRITWSDQNATLPLTSRGAAQSAAGVALFHLAIMLDQWNQSTFDQSPAARERRRLRIWILVGILVSLLLFAFLFAG